MCLHVPGHRRLKPERTLVRQNVRFFQGSENMSRRCTEPVRAYESGAGEELICRIALRSHFSLRKALLQNLENSYVT